MKNSFPIRLSLGILLVISLSFAFYSIYYKTKYWGFSLSPKQTSNVWAIESHINFIADDAPVKVTLRIPTKNRGFKVLEESITAKEYKVKKLSDRIVFSHPKTSGEQNLYYKLMVFDNTLGKDKVRAPAPENIKKPHWNKQITAQAKQIIELSQQLDGRDNIEKMIKFFNQEPMDATLKSMLPVQYNQKTALEFMSNILSLEDIPTRIARGIKLEEGQTVNPDLMLEAYINGAWWLYNPKTGKQGLPDNFLVFQRGEDSLLDVAGGSASSIKFSLQKSITSSMNLAERRAQLSKDTGLFNYSIYNLPIAQQNTLKWLSVFPIGILIVVLMRNIVGIQTMGTFTPMLISMSLVKTGFITGLTCFLAIVLLGLGIRFLMSKFNLLLVPRISAVVIFVILIIHALTIIGYNFDIKIAQASVFFPIIITAWIIERASITWEEDGPINASRELINSLIVGIIVYFVIANDTIRHIMFAFNELNIVILIVVMLLGTYTGYRLTELKRFAPLVKK
ncbi:MAG: hypothetical protein E7004_04135 [Alphaproteobacteria bacterium]|nr:hypothetical protein [Alphaproteobacteria bacterium]